MKFKKLFGFLLATAIVANINPAIAEDDEDEDNEVDLTSAVITALPCAQEAAENEDYEILSSLAKCPPHIAYGKIKGDMVKTIYGEVPAKKFYFAPPQEVVFDVTEGDFYLVKYNDALSYSDMLEGFGGSLDGSGVIVGKKGDIPVVEFEEATITPRPKPGFFKGCL